MNLRILAIGDIIGRPGRNILKKNLSKLRQHFNPTVIIANIENASGGFGITWDTYQEIRDYGVDIMTSGNHHFDQRGEKDWMNEVPDMVRPLNFPPGHPGNDLLVLDQWCSKPLVMLNLLGRTFMKPYDCPFRAAEHVLQQYEDAIILLDFHAETTSEKMAMGHFVTGKVSAMWGTHTHVPTADARILGGYTGYLTDLGMTGPYDSVIGMRTESVLPTFLTLDRSRFEVAKGDVRVGACLYDIDIDSGRCERIQNLWLTEEEIRNLSD